MAGGATSIYSNYPLSLRSIQGEYTAPAGARIACNVAMINVVRMRYFHSGAPLKGSVGKRHTSFVVMCRTDQLSIRGWEMQNQVCMGDCSLVGEIDSRNARVKCVNEFDRPADLHVGNH